MPRMVSIFGLDINFGWVEYCIGLSEFNSTVVSFQNRTVVVVFRPSVVAEGGTPSPSPRSPPFAEHAVAARRNAVAARSSAAAKDVAGNSSAPPHCRIGNLVISLIRGLLIDVDKALVRGGETSTSNTYVDNEANEDDESEDWLDEMFHDVGEEFTDRSNELDELLSDSKQPLWPGCSKYTRLSAVLKLFNLKAGNGWSDKSFTALLGLLKDMLPEDNELSKNTYDAKKILCPMGMEYEKIHACPNDCILFRNDYKELHACPICGASRYKPRDACPICGASRYKPREHVVGSGASRYKPREHVVGKAASRYKPREHVVGKASLKGQPREHVVGKASLKGPPREHVVGKASLKGPQAKVLWYLPILPRFKRMFSNPSDAKNLTWHVDKRISDGKLRHPADSPQWKTFDNAFPEFGHESRNLRLGLCTDGINPHGNLSNLKKLWDEGVIVFDAYRKENFKLQAMLFCTINDFPAYGNLSGYSVKGHKTLDVRHSIDVMHGKTLDVRHSIDVMHVEKNVPQWYSSNIRTLVNMQDLKLVGLKSYDCYALMQQLLPVAVRGILPKKLRYTIIRLCFFFNAICGKVIDPDKLDELENGITVTLCQLEMYFPPSFFDIMVHLVVHLVREIRQCDPAYLRLMCPFERYMKVLKGYVRNRYRPEASIVESYIAEEVTEFYTEYLAGVEAIGVSKYRHEGRIAGKGTRGTNVQDMPRKDVEQAHLYILHNTSEVEPYLDEHKALIKEQNPRRTYMWIVSEHNRNFISWFKSKVLKDKNVSETVRWLAHGPGMQVICYTRYDINGFSFYTKEQDDMSIMQNSRVSLVANSMHFNSSKDKNPVIVELSYYGVIEEIWEVDYVQFRVPMFRCKWVDSKHGVKANELGFTLVDLNREGHKNEQFIMASQAKQVFYVTDSCDKKWSIVLHGKKQITGDLNEDVSFDIEEIPPFSLSLLPVMVDNEIDEVHASRDDHHEGIWEH
ncbi:uncharacterized protein LOC116029770 [Ipomoea triloba]|uniref:uncharacterized protein LOC116029770 n=1 Tax=Ipomoea triloba TaxID=35885 RepID=UPI00125E4FDD|nr:uncharacterized protein LOC116029770 [Ipomoea triloba]